MPPFLCDDYPSMMLNRTLLLEYITYISGCENVGTSCIEQAAHCTAGRECHHMEHKHVQWLGLQLSPLPTHTLTEYTIVLPASTNIFIIHCIRSCDIVTTARHATPISCLSFIFLLRHLRLFFYYLHGLSILRFTIIEYFKRYLSSGEYAIDASSPVSMV